jgi:hypothetical protein
VKLSREPSCLSLTVLPILIVGWLEQLPESVSGADPPPELARHLTAIAELAHAAPMVSIIHLIIRRESSPPPTLDAPLLSNLALSGQDRRIVREGIALFKKRNSFGHDTPLW